MSLVSYYETLYWVREESIHNFRHDDVNIIITIKFLELINNHFQFWDAVDTNNSGSMEPIELEDTCNNIRCPTRVFILLLAVSKANYPPLPCKSLLKP